MKKSVLVINDDLAIGKQIKYSLQNDCTDVHYARTVHEGLQSFIRHSYTLVIMDIAFSEADGVALLETMRRCKTVPILVLSSRCGIEDKVRALDAGADDFLSHPFDMAECLARTRALMRRYTELSGETKQCYTLAFGPDLIIEPQYRRAIKDGEALELTRTEFDMLYYLASNAGQVLTREQLYGWVRKTDALTDVDGMVRYHIKELRKKLGGDTDSSYIQTIWGVGYRFSPDLKRERGFIKEES